MKNNTSSVESSTPTVNSQLKLTIVSGLIVMILGLVAEYTAFQPTNFSKTTALILVLMAVYAYLSVRYWLILGYGNSRSASELKLYRQLREEVYRIGNFKDDVNIGQIYNQKVTALMDWVDRLYGDAESSAHSVGSRFFKLNTPKPVWTYTSYDRSFWFAFIYTVVSMFLVWAATDHVGIVESAIGLPNADLSMRVLIVTSVVIAFIFNRLSERLGDLHSWISAVIIFGGVFVFALDSNLGLYGLGGYIGPFLLALLAIIGIHLGSFVPSGMQIVNSLVVFGFAFTVLDANTNAFGYAVALTLSYAAILLIAKAIEYASESKVLSAYLPWILFLHLVFITVIIAWVCFNSGQNPNWLATGPSLLIFVTLTMINAPFDWLSLGITRGLLRKGLELRGWMPALLGIVDIFAATIVMVCLTVSVLFAVQAFNTMATLGGAEIFLKPTDYLLAFGDAKQRWEPQYYWIYIMLFSTMIPSVCNVVIGLMSIARGFAPLYRFIETQKIPTKEAVPTANRMLFAPLIALNRMVCVFGGILLSMLALYAIWTMLLPLIGINLYSMALALNEENYPTQFIIWVLSSIN